MDTHKNAPLTPKGREMMVRAVVDCGLSKAAAARQFNTTAKTVAKWVERFRAEGVDGLRDRSSRPHSLPSQTAPAECAAIEALRRRRYTAKQIAVEIGAKSSPSPTPRRPTARPSDSSKPRFANGLTAGIGKRMIQNLGIIIQYPRVCIIMVEVRLHPNS